MARLPRPVTIRMSEIPAVTASSMTYWIVGLSTIGSISFGCDFVAGRNRVPRPAAGMTAFRTLRMGASYGPTRRIDTVDHPLGRFAPRRAGGGRPSGRAGPSGRSDSDAQL